jgi:hypothetical protein
VIHSISGIQTYSLHQRSHKFRTRISCCYETSLKLFKGPFFINVMSPRFDEISSCVSEEPRPTFISDLNIAALINDTRN